MASPDENEKLDKAFSNGTAPQKKDVERSADEMADRTDKMEEETADSLSKSVTVGDKMEEGADSLSKSEAVGDGDKMEEGTADSLSKSETVGDKMEEDTADSLIKSETVGDKMEEGTADALSKSETVGDKMEEGTADALSKSETVGDKMEEGTADALSKSETVGDKMEEGTADSLSKSETVGDKIEEGPDESAEKQEVVEDKMEEDTVNSVSTLEAIADKTEEEVEDSVSKTETDGDKIEKKTDDSVSTSEAVGDKKAVEDSLSKMETDGDKMEEGTNDSVKMIEAVGGKMEEVEDFVNESETVGDKMEEDIDVSVEKQEAVEEKINEEVDDSVVETRDIEPEQMNEKEKLKKDGDIYPVSKEEVINDNTEKSESTAKTTELSANADITENIKNIADVKESSADVKSVVATSNENNVGIKEPASISYVDMEDIAKKVEPSLTTNVTEKYEKSADSFESSEKANLTDNAVNITESVDSHVKENTNDFENTKHLTEPDSTVHAIDRGENATDIPKSATEVDVTNNSGNTNQSTETAAKVVDIENIKQKELLVKDNIDKITELEGSSVKISTHLLETTKSDCTSVSADATKTISELQASNGNIPEMVSATGTKDTTSISEISEDARIQIAISSRMNNEAEILTVSTKATFGDSSCDNMSMSGLSESKSGTFEGTGKVFPVEKLASDDSDMNQLKEERLAQYLKSMQETKVEAVDNNKETESVENKIHSQVEDNLEAKSSINELTVSPTLEVKNNVQINLPETVKCTGESVLPESNLKLQNKSCEFGKVSEDRQHVNSDRSTESSNGERSQSDLEVASIMKKGVRKEEIDSNAEVPQVLPTEDSCMTEQNEDTKIPDIEISAQNEDKEIWKDDQDVSLDTGRNLISHKNTTVVDEERQKLEGKQSQADGSSCGGSSKEINQSLEKDHQIETETEGEKDTQILMEKEMDSAFIKLPVSNKGKKDQEQPREILKRKMFDEFTEDSSNSSWYIIKDKQTEESMDTDDKNRRLIVTDEGSNLSIPDDSSLASASGMEDSRMSFTDQVSNIDETSNLSAEDSCSVKAFGHEPVLDESANLNPPDKDIFVQPSTPSSVVTDVASEATPVKRYRRGTLAIAVEEASEHGHNIQAKDLFEYQWPQESGADWFMLQEQISTYLEVKSFKRKYPDLVRRVCDKIEKDFLREKGVVSETQSDLGRSLKVGGLAANSVDPDETLHSAASHLGLHCLLRPVGPNTYGLTALRSEDVHELISKDYPSKYREYCTALHEKEKEKMASKQKDYVLPKLEKSKMREYTMKAMKSTSEWNRQFLKERNEERRAYFDMQTFAIQYPKSKFRKVENIKSVPTAYPVSLIPGQFQEYCRKYSAEELKYFPLNTALFDPPKKMEQQGKEVEQTAQTQEQEVQKAASGSDSGDESSSDSGESEVEAKGKGDGEKEKEKSVSREPSAEKNRQEVITELYKPVAVKAEETTATCRVCCDEDKPEKQRSERQRNRRKSIKADEELMQCSECKKSGHPSCLDLTDAMLKVIKTYPWQCMDCKTCVECMDPYDEDKMLFCDQCDRGYHTFCVGLRSLPTGKWECVSCRGDSTPVKPIPKALTKPTTKGKRGRKPKNPIDR